MNKRTAVNVSRGPGRPRLPLEAIIGAAVSLVDELGPGALSMRALAHRLETGTAVLYRAVSGRAELVGMMVDSVLGDDDLDRAVGAERSWQAACRDAAQSLFAALSRHPGVAALVIETVPLGANALAMRERMLATLLAQGFTAPEAALMYATLARFAIGFAAQVHSSGQDVEASTIREVFLALDVEEYRATRAVAQLLPQQSIGEEFTYGLEMLLAGIAHSRGEKQERAAPPS